MSEIADETLWNGAVGFYDAATFTRIINYTVAHELGHLVIDARGSPGWDQHEHTGVGNGSLMADPPVQDLDARQFTDAEINRIDLPGRTSVEP